MQQKIFKNAENHDFGWKRQKNPRKTAGLGTVLAKSGGEERKRLQRKGLCAGGRRTKKLSKTAEKRKLAGKSAGRSTR